MKEFLSQLLWLSWTKSPPPPLKADFQPREGVAPGSFESDHIESGRKNNQDCFLAPPFGAKHTSIRPFSRLFFCLPRQRSGSERSATRSTIPAQTEFWEA